MLYISGNGLLAVPRNELEGNETFTLKLKRYAGEDLTFSNVVPFFVGGRYLQFEVPLIDLADGQYTLTLTTGSYKYVEDVLISIPQRLIDYQTSEVIFEYSAPTFYVPKWILETSRWAGNGIWTPNGLWQ